MKILYVTNMYPYTEYAYFGIHVKEQIESIVKAHEVEYLLYFINGRRAKLNYLYSIFKINRILWKDKTIDLVHIHFGLSGIFLLFNPFLKVPIILSLHGSDVNTTNRLTRLLVKMVIARSQKVIVMNHQMLEQVKPSVNDVVVIPCGIDLTFFVPTNKTAKGPARIGFPGDPNRIEKNYPLFVEVIRLLREQGRDLEETIFHNLSRNEVVENLNQINVLLLTSFNEGSPQIIKEALACGTSIVSVPVGDVPNVIDTVPNCRIAKDHDAGEIVKEVSYLLDHAPWQENNLGKRRIQEIGLDQESIAKRIYTLYTELNK